ncbi:nucleotidyl transferase AbiEii/AbiGii toxin family protein [Ralstonia pseudosolanacearum]|uniref:nucleotidyl transferase AbiEii/AbiGii toxin family protein n=1 Tax=Ralstonia pseudosolanacearum TaxID=1310165 RepID=UPI001FF9D89C|nr:nucleotidyl transferase AbiEii/AbiGii toxin family protein [Ralstonia pseudosolanacearum]
MTPLHLKTPLPEEKQAVLIIMDRVARQANLRYLVVGATARDILMYHLHGFPLNRASPDIDFAIAVESWSAFDGLRAALLQEPTLRPDAKIPHRLHYSATVGEGFPVDLVPFGGVEIAPAQVAWPLDMAITMNAAGYAEALDSAVTVYIADDCEVPVASIPGLVMTKLIAWLDRGQSNPKDAVDFRYLLENYADAGNADRLYGEELPLLAACDYALELVGPRLLGLDVASVASAESKRQIVDILADRQLYDRLVVHMLRGEAHSDGAVEKIESQLAEFRIGLTEWPGP